MGPVQDYEAYEVEEGVEPGRTADGALIIQFLSYFWSRNPLVLAIVALCCMLQADLSTSSVP